MDMEFFPVLGLGWLNGWILLGIWLSIQGLSVLIVPKDIRDRLFEFNRSSWGKRERGLFATGKILGLVFLIVAALTTIHFDEIEFLIGLVIYTIGLIGLVTALRDFKNTPLDRPVAIGVYKFSRHPQLLMLLIIGVGLSITLSSWFLFILRFLSFGFEHAGVLAEERECLERFGDSYREYMEKVPRYLGI